jgi:competence protein ComEC
LTSPGLLFSLAVVLLLTGWSWNRLIRQQQPPAEVWFFDVGQGDAILIREKGGQTILVDGGKPGSGYQVLMPALDELAIGRIDLAIATHGHDDHAGGLIELARRGRIRQLMISSGETDAIKPQPAAVAKSPVRGEKNILSELVSICRDRGIDVQAGAAHDTIMLGQAVRLRILHPLPEVRNEPANEPLQASPDANAQALQILAELCNQRFLLTSDCTAEVERDLLENGAWPRVDLLEVAHHGSRKTTETAFLDQVRPQDAVISVGTNFYGHPAVDTLKRLMMAGCDILRTDQSGAINCQIQPEGYTITTWLEPAA